MIRLCRIQGFAFYSGETPESELINKKVLATWLKYPLFDDEYEVNGLAHSIELRDNIYALLSGKFRIVNRYGSEKPNFKAPFMYLRRDHFGGEVYEDRPEFLVKTSFYQVHPWQVRPVLKNGWIKI